MNSSGLFWSIVNFLACGEAEKNGYTALCEALSSFA